MNLADFLEYRVNCPVCQGKLSTLFHSHKKQKTFIDSQNNELIAIFDLKTLSKKVVSKAAFHINIFDNSFYLNFYDQYGNLFTDFIPLRQIKQFKHLDANHNHYQIHQQCSECKQYNYKSSSFKLNYSKQNIGNLEIQSEYFSLYQQTADGYISHRLLNWYQQSESWILSKQISARAKRFDEPSELDLFIVDNALSVNLIKCKHLSAEQLINKINNILLFA